jgi:membrane protein required for colicin V production|tara:strand:+ start:2229 stop:2789 length:561 start_codon:yes stop_codon:yes gene_type:complete
VPLFQFNHGFDFIAIVITLALTIIGYHRGFLEELARLVALLFATAITVRYAGTLAFWLQERVAVDGRILSSASFIVLFASVLFVTRLLTRFLQVFMLSKGIRWANRYLGVVFGFLKGVVTIMVILWMIDMIPNQNYFRKLKSDSFVYRQFTIYRDWSIYSFGLQDSVIKSELWLKERMNSGDSLRH